MAFVLSFPQFRFSRGEEQTHMLDNLFWNKGNGADGKCLMGRLFIPAGSLEPSHGWWALILSWPGPSVPILHGWGTSPSHRLHLTRSSESVFRGLQIFYKMFFFSLEDFDFITLVH